MFLKSLQGPISITKYMISKLVFVRDIYKLQQYISELVTTRGIPSAGQYWVFYTQLAYNPSFKKSCKSVFALTNLKFFCRFGY